MTQPTTAGRIAEAWRAAIEGAAAMPSLDTRLLAIGWATVELDRATSELARALGLPGGERFTVAARSETLGGTARVASGVLPDGGGLVVLEPDTEGRLAGSLARLGEGPVAAWLAVTEPGIRPAALRRAGLTVSTERAGPFGPERLVLAGPADTPGRHRLLVVRPAGTIQP